MNTAVLTLMTPEEIGHSLRTTHLEQAYERALREADRIYEEERARVLRVQLLLLEDENESLADLAVQYEEDRDRLEETADIIRQDLVETEANLQRTQIELKARLKDIENFKAEIKVLNATSTDSTKILTEKLGLARELAAIKPELEHLKSQASTQTNLLSEKLSLQRQLSTIQVELETERRTVQRTKAADKKSGEEDSKLAATIDELKKELAKEKRDSQKNDRDSKKQAADWEGQKTILESKLDAFRTKLRTTKEQLKETQKDLEEAQATNNARQAEFAASKPATVNPRKRPVARFDPDITIGTPGMHVAKKARMSAMPGDKSSFSITPFLNRTMSILPDSPAETEKDAHQEAEEVISSQINAIVAETEQVQNEVASKIAPVKPAPKKASVATVAKLREPKVKALKESTNLKSSRPVAQQRLAKVAEEAEAAPEDDSTGEEKENPSALPVMKPLIKKKQKVLGQRKSLFDDDEDADPGRKKAPIALSGAPGLRGGGGFSKISLASKAKVLAEFSPLKKDRKAGSVQAS